METKRAFSPFSVENLTTIVKNVTRRGSKILKDAVKELAKSLLPT